MNRVIAKAVSGLYRRLPWTIQEACFEQHRRQRGDEVLLMSIGQSLGATGLIVEGRYGPFEGSINDRAILPAYGRSGIWAERTVHAIVEHAGGRGTGTYLDIGANVGLTTVPVAEQTRLRCHAFEPDPTNFRHLQANVWRHGLTERITPVQLAVSDRQGALTLELSPTNLGDHRLRLASSVTLQGEDQRELVDVETRRLDDLDLDITPPLIAKIDTQGAEPLVISGGMETLRQADFIVLEFSPYLMNRMGSDPEAIYSLIQDFGSVAISKGEMSQADSTTDGTTAAETLRSLYSDNVTSIGDAYWDIVCTRK